MPTPILGAPLAEAWDYRLIALSVVIAVIASYAALDLGGRVNAKHGRSKHLWLAGGSATMGLGIWAMHYIGMLALKLPVEVLYHWPTVLLSLLAAMIASLIALFIVSRKTLTRGRTIIGGTLMGMGIASMHYAGMEAMRLPAMCHYSAGMVVLSLVLAISIAIVALQLTFRLRDEKSAASWRKLTSALLMGGAIPIMHYTGMAAVTFMPMASAQDLANTVEISWLGTLGIGAVVIAVLTLTILTSIIDSRLVEQALELKRLAVDLKFQNENLEQIVSSRTRELADAHNRLKILDNAKDDFLKIISHELRTPLNGLLGASEIILSEAGESAATQEFRTLFDESRHRMLSILDDALLLTEIEVDAGDFKSAPFCVSSAMRNATACARSFAEARAVNVQAAPADLGKVHGDEGLATRAFRSLIETAIKFSDQGETVCISGNVNSDSIRISIESVGRRIPDEALPRFFDIFSISEAITSGGDLGLSAPLSARVLALFGGKLSVVNREQQGINLTVEFGLISEPACAS